MIRYEQLTTIEALDAQVNASGQNAVDYYIEALENQ
jgi:hypothetical protein